MNSDTSSSWSAPAATSDADALRRQVVDVATEVIRGTSCTSGTGKGFATDSSDQSAMNLYLALLTDRLPVFARTLMALPSRVGEGSVEENLVAAAQATVQFYTEILAAKVSVFTKPDQLVQLRRVLREHDFGPQVAHARVTGYLEEERRLGRIGEDVDCAACAQLLLGACVNYAFTKMLLDDVPPRDGFVESAVKGLRLTS